MKTPQQIGEMASKAWSTDSSCSFDFPEYLYGFKEGATWMQKELLEELKHLCTYNSTAIGKQAECYLKVMPTLIEILDKYGIGVFLRGIVYRTYTQARKDLLDSASEGFDDCFSKYATENNLHHEFDAHFFWQACALSYEKKIQEEREAFSFTSESRVKEIQDKDERIKKLEYELHEQNTIGANSNYAHKEIILEKDAEIERLKKDSQSYYENNQKIIKSLELKEDKYQEAVKDIDFLMSHASTEWIGSWKLEEIKTKYGLDKKEK